MISYNGRNYSFVITVQPALHSRSFLWKVYRGQSGQDEKVTTHSHTVQRLMTSGTTSSLFRMSSRGDA
jgi:hypothetical protein